MSIFIGSSRVRLSNVSFNLYHEKFFAQLYFEGKVIPREGRDLEKEKEHFTKHGEHIEIYRKLRPSEVGGSPYSLWSSYFDVDKLGVFGQGIAVYFFQLLILMGICIVAGCILIPCMLAYLGDHYAADDHDVRVKGTAACMPAVTVLAICGRGLNTSSNQSVYINETHEIITYYDDDMLNSTNATTYCEAQYRDNCAFPSVNAAWSDLAMIVGFAICLIGAELWQNYFQEAIDYSVESAQDYSLFISNPPPDASDPDEWHSFFSRFGVVRYITVNRDNADLLKLLLQKRLLLRKSFPTEKPEDIAKLDHRAKAVSALPLSFCRRLGWALGLDVSSEEYLLRRLAELNSQIEKLCELPRRVCGVFVTFELEDAQSHCLKILKRERSLLAALLCLTKTRYRFRGVKRLRAFESSEPDNVAYLNIGIRARFRFLRSVLSFLFAFGIMYLSYMAITYVHHDAILLLVTITLIDSGLPVIFGTLSFLEGSIDEDDRQNTLMVKLFMARLLTSTIFPFVNTPWSNFLDASTLVRIKNIQLSSCFVNPVIKLLDLNGLLYRYILTTCFAKTQADADRYWSGSPFTLSERYTEVAKILFISLFYSLLDPTSLFIAAIACVNLYTIDRFILLRRSAQPPMLDNSMGPTANKQIAVALLIKVIVSIYFLYSWPMDEVYTNSEGEFVMVDKVPRLGFWRMKREAWMTEEQWRPLRYYKAIVYVTIALVAIVLLFDVFEGIYSAICESSDPISSGSGQIPFSAVENMSAYCPLVRYGPESFVAADTRLMLRR
jgi:hypothetical protein